MRTIEAQAGGRPFYRGYLSAPPAYGIHDCSYRAPTRSSPWLIRFAGSTRSSASKSVAAQRARLLQRSLGQLAIQAEFIVEIASVIHSPRSMSTRADLAFPETRGERP